MGLLLVFVGALVVAAIAFGVAAFITGTDPGLAPVEPDGRAVPLPADRPLMESDFAALRFDTALRGYRMDQVDAALRRAAYDLGYKEELIAVLEAEVAALRAGRLDEADRLRLARAAALAPPAGSAAQRPDEADKSTADAGDSDREGTAPEETDRVEVADAVGARLPLTKDSPAGAR